MFKFFFILFILILPELLLGAPIKGFYELNYNSEIALLQGKVFFELDKEGLYEFSVRDIRLLEITIENSPAKFSQKEDKIIIFNPKKNTSLKIQFERDLPLKPYLNGQIVEHYLPYPLFPCEYEISLKLSPKERVFFTIPSEEKDTKKEESITVFRINKPLSQPPPLILGKFLEKVIKVDDVEIFFLFPTRQRIDEAEWKTFESHFKKEVSKLLEKKLLFPFDKFFLVVYPEKKILPLTIASPLNLRDKETVFSLLKESFRHTLLFALNLREPFLIESFTLYLIDYWLNEKKITLRREFLSGSFLGGEAFYFFYERLGANKEEEFIYFLADYLKRALFSEFKDLDFLKKLSEKFGIAYPLPSKEVHFCKINIKALTGIQYLEKAQKYHLTLKLFFEPCFRPHFLRIQIHGAKEITEKVLFIDEREKTYDFYLKEKPHYLLIDPHFEVYRTLSFSEKALNLETFLRRKGIIYLPHQELYPLYKDLIQELKEQGYQIKISRPTLYELLSLSEENIIFLEQMPQGFHLNIPKEGFFLKTIPHPGNLDKNMVFIKASSTKELKEALSKRQQWIRAEEVHFQKGRPLVKREPPLNSGIRIDLSEIKNLLGIKTSSFLPFEHLVLDLLPYQVILVGENHDQYSHHLFQLELIKGLSSFTKDLAIGLEMVQRPFQRYLDEFVEGKISEQELLEKIEYYDRWRFDWRLYREIFLFAREKKIKLVALDLPQELVKKVFREGLTSLNNKEREILPELDFPNPAYEAYLKRSFEAHSFDNNTSFEFFYQAQAIRDEGMAEKILEFVRNNPQMKMIVLTGKGHLLYGYGIPYALKRRNFTNFKTVILGDLEEPKAMAGDYWFTPPPLAYEKTPQLGLVLEETERGLKVKEVLRNSLGEKGGLKVGDILLKMDGHPLKKVSSVKLLLTFKRKGEKIILDVERDSKIEKIELEIK